MNKLIQCSTPELALALADYLCANRNYERDSNISPDLAERFSILKPPFTLNLLSSGSTVTVSWWSSGKSEPTAIKVKNLKEGIAATKKEDAIKVRESNGTEHEIEFQSDGSLLVGCASISSEVFEKIVKARSKAMKK